MPSTCSNDITWEEHGTSYKVAAEAMLETMEQRERQRLRQEAQQSVKTSVFLSVDATATRLMALYLDVLPVRQAYAMARLRFGELPTGESLGRQHNPPIPRAARTCRFCSSGQVEISMHLLGRCIGNTRMLLARGELFMHLRRMSPQKAPPPVLRSMDGPSLLGSRHTITTNLHEPAGADTNPY